MAREIISRTRCDRCKSVIEEADAFGDVEAEESPKPVLYVECRGEAPINFADLCKKCTDRVKNLCTQMRLEKKGDDDQKSTKSPKTRTTKDKPGEGTEAASPAN